MNSFGKLLRRYIEKSGYSIYGIAQKSNINRTTLQKVLADERTPSQDMIQHLRPFLKLTPIESAELDEAFEMIQIGEEVFKQRRQIKRLLENVSYILPSQKPVSDNKMDEPELLPVSGLHVGRFVIQQLLRELLLWECVLPPSALPHLCINVPANLKLFRDVFIQSIQECRRSGIPIYHLTNFSKNSTNRDGHAFNLEVLANILPFLPLDDFHYQVYYYYGNSPLANPYQSAFPYYVLFSTSTLLLSSDCQTAVLSYDTDLHHYLENLFAAAMKEASAFTVSYHDPEDILPHLMEMDLEDLPFYSLEYQPCLTSYLTERMIQNYAKVDNTESSSLLRLTAMRAKQLRGLNHHISIFSKTGLRHFAQTGLIADLPSRYALPLSLQDRLFILDCLYRDIQSGQRKHRTINPLILPISDHLICLFHQNAGLDFSFFSQEGNHYGYLRIEEPSLLESFDDFFKYLLQSPMVNTQEETLAAIRECIEDIKYMKNALPKSGRTLLS